MDFSFSDVLYIYYICFYFYFKYVVILIKLNFLMYDKDYKYQLKMVL